jgi:predicted AlkP superfamily pyrophosphatase or phosphodiesterase
VRRFSFRLTWWHIVPVALLGAVLNFFPFGSRVRAMPPTPTVSEPPAKIQTAAKPKIKRVLIISEDGLRPDAVGTLHLHWHSILRKRGSYSLHAKTTRDASTLPAHASMLSGVHPQVHGLTWNNWRPSKGFIKSPTIFTAAQDAGLTTAFFTGKSKLRHIVPPSAVGMYERPGYYCRKVAEAAADYLVKEKPALAFVHFSDPDEVGHSAGWMSAKQLKAIAEADRCLGILHQALEQSGLIDDTLIIVTADHGGHNRVHSGAKPVDREIPWIACGPGVREDHVLEGEISTVDTAATALYALGLPIPADIAGKPRTEIFEAVVE